MAAPIAVMPGSFLSFTDYDRAHLFQPPPTASPSASVSSLVSLTRSYSFSSSGQRRKRPRVEAASFQRSCTASTPQARLQTGDVADYQLNTKSGGEGVYDSDVTSPAPLVSTDYRLKDGLDTPRAAEAERLDWDDHEARRDWRQDRFAQESCQKRDSYFPATPESLNGGVSHGSGRRRRSRPSAAGNHSRSRTEPGWSRTVWNMTGGVAGKLINFCITTAFHGFHAGDGTGYELDLGTPNIAATESEKWLSMQGREDVFHHDYKGRPTVTDVPGGFPQETLVENYGLRRRIDSATPTQWNESGSGSTLRSQWVMVDQPSTDAGDTSPVKKKARPSTAAMHQQRPKARASDGGPEMRPRLQISRSSVSTSHASHASPRARQNYSVSPATQDQRQPSSASLLHQPPPFQPHHKRSRSSIASVRSSIVLSHRTNPSPVEALTATPTTPNSPDVAQFQRKLRRKEQAQDESIRRFNQQLKDMIREGKQALGTRVVVGDETVRGWDEDENENSDGDVDG